MGAPSEAVREKAAERKIRLVDYFADDALAALNAIPTCEGAIGILLSRRERVLWNSRVLVVGFGRIGKLLAQRLAGFGALVTVAARRLPSAPSLRRWDTGYNRPSHWRRPRRGLRSSSTPRRRCWSTKR